MAKLRKAVAYRRIERPYTRKSKYRTQQFVRATPHNKVVKFNMGNLKKRFEYSVVIKPRVAIQLRHNALEAARLTSNRYLEKMCGKTGFRLDLLVYPHHILRENPLASGAGADRMSTGMKKSFGKSIGLAAQVRAGQEIFKASIDANFLDAAKKAITRIKHKLPCSCTIEIRKNEVLAA